MLHSKISRRGGLLVVVSEEGTLRWTPVFASGGQMWGDQHQDGRTGRNRGELSCVNPREAKLPKKASRAKNGRETKTRYGAK